MKQLRFASKRISVAQDGVTEHSNTIPGCPAMRVAE